MRDFAIFSDLKGGNRSLIHVHQRPNLHRSVGRTSREIINRELTRDFLEGAKWSVLPSSPIIEAIECAARGNIIAELTGQLRRDGVGFEPEILGIKIERWIMSGVLRLRVCDLAVQCGIDVLKPLPRIGKLGIVLEVLRHLVANQIGVNNEEHC